MARGIVDRLQRSRYSFSSTLSPWQPSTAKTCRVNEVEDDAWGVSRFPSTAFFQSQERY
jgi:hypothetical protein